MKRNTRIELLRNVWLFERCSKKELEAIARVATPLDLPAGKLLTTQGQKGSEFFVIVTGTARAVREGVEIGTLGPGSFFGEMSLLEDLPRVATVTTTEPTTVLVVHGRAAPSTRDTFSRTSVTRGRLLRDDWFPVAGS